ncbi:yippee-domain-containing protein [Aspergillus homomorphus CBS 101889]|uniref:Yippee-domain-containing protein n=1 Tax=Aspergillus homomorphus (strain CBS 101889) TaxID=1450537 RepID=A0A395HIC2_ASPHC|nr:yippee-domain-containing protein [Aspergillus homomorphus CBS 101889]RAL07557.1 yippee-domain-containing protein [Aspergillus homomorphus CBS 101889]
MSKSSNDISSRRFQLQQCLERSFQASVLASCYSVNTTASTVTGFHYCTTGHSGIPEVPSGYKSPSSPPLDLSLLPGLGVSWSGNSLSEHKGEAAHAIPEECERLFCEHMSVIFLGERRFIGQDSPGIGAYQSRPAIAESEHTPIQHWLEVLDYTNDITYRGFVASTSDGQPTVFVFFDQALGHSLKTGLVALFELASISIFGCSQIVACIPRSRDTVELEIVRNFGWCGFSLTTLQQWSVGNAPYSLSDRWLFLLAEIRSTNAHSLALMFPKFLLYSGIVRPKHRGLSSELGQIPCSDERNNNGNERILNGHVSCIRCSHCAADLCLTSQIISKGFTGRHGRALLVSAETVASAISISASSATTECLPNTIVQKPVFRRLVTGAHTVSDINCALCGTVLGWKYVSAEEESQRYKIGKFILETEKITISSVWESADLPTDPPVSYPEGPRPKLSAKRMEFDSQDEDECEDLFAGIWSPGLAMRRRSRKLDHDSPLSRLTPS